MSELSDTFGADFADEVEERIQQRRKEREKVPEEALREICHLAVNEGKFDSDNPIFQYTTDNGVTHDVLLMEVPDLEDSSIWNYANELDSGAVTMPLSFLGQWMSCLFNDPDDARNLEEGEYYIVVGNLSTWTNDKGQENDQLSPVRGVVHHEKAREWADQYLEGKTVTEPDQPSQKESEAPTFGGGDDEEEDDDSGGLFGSSEDEEEEEDLYTMDDIKALVDGLGDEHPEVWEIEDKSDDRLEQLATVVTDRLELDNPDSDTVRQVAEDCLEYLTSEDEEEEDDKDETDALF